MTVPHFPALRSASTLVAGAVIAVGPLLLASPASAEPIGGPQLTGSSVVVDPGPSASALPDIQASTWVLANMDTGAILAAKGPHVQRPPASTLKTLTALALMPKLDPNEVYTATRSDISVDGSRVGLVEGGTYTVAQLFQGLFLQSGNDCASSLANVNGGLDKTMSDINAEAQRIQAFDTVAKNPSGLPEDGQVSSAYDLALIGRAGLQRPDYFAYANTLEVDDFPGYMPENPGDPRPTMPIATQNPLFIEGYPGAIGLKTGWTTEAGRTFVGAAKQGDTTLIVALMNIESPIYDAASALLDWGFQNVNDVTPVGYLVDPVAPEAGSPSASQGTQDSGTTATSGEQSSTSQTPAGANAATATDQGGESSSSGWIWGLIAAMGVGLLLVVLGLRSMRAATRQPAGRRRTDERAREPVGPR